ncbi:TNT domain-containing protein [Saccharopolyspora gloriosae]|uniref:TNT domain-containing protein n=1 Tax=Saccharopolyspora gloriosae TaxID=455344 RepID=UPI001FB702D7|nr:TNT domain-containing protein [Saccharopolyspora gloriosae]
MSRPTAISPEEQEQIARRIGVLLLQAAPEDWQQITVEYRATGEYQDLLGEVAAQDGGTEPWEPPEELWAIFEHLREGMYRPDVGTWLSALYVVERPSSYRIDINFDAEPQWQRPLPRAAYADELRRYPRTDDNVPDWMRAKLDAASVPAESAGPGPAQPPAPPAPAPQAPAPAAQASAVQEPAAAERAVQEPAEPGLPVREPSRPEPQGSAPAQAPAFGAAFDQARPDATGPSTSDDPHAGFRTALVFDDFDEQGRPLVATRAPVHQDEVGALRHYLENAPIVLASRDNDDDLLDPNAPASVPSTWHTDGVWVWPGAVPYYLVQYGVPPQPELVEHVRSRRFALTEVDDRTRDAAVRELFDQPDFDQADAAGYDDRATGETPRVEDDFAVQLPAPAQAREDEDTVAESRRDFPEEINAFAAPGPEAGFAASAPQLPHREERSEQAPADTDLPLLTHDSEPPLITHDAEHVEQAPAGLDLDDDAADPGSRHGVDADEDLDETQAILARLHDRLIELGVDSSEYRVGSHSADARCLLRDEPGWVVTAGEDDLHGDLHFEHADQAAAFLLGSLLLSSTEPLPAAEDQRRRSLPDPVDEPEVPEQAEQPEARVAEPEPEVPAGPASGAAAGIGAAGAGAAAASDERADSSPFAAFGSTPESPADGLFRDHRDEPVAAQTGAGPEHDSRSEAAEFLGGETGAAEGRSDRHEPSNSEPDGAEADQVQRSPIADLPRRGSTPPEPPQRQPEAGTGGHFLFTANQAPAEPESADGGDFQTAAPDAEATRFQPLPTPPGPNVNGSAPNGAAPGGSAPNGFAPNQQGQVPQGPGGPQGPAQPGPQQGGPGQQAPANQSLPQRGPRPEQDSAARPPTGGPGPQGPHGGPGAGPTGGAERRPGPPGPGMAGPPRQGPGPQGPQGEPQGRPGGPIKRPPQNGPGEQQHPQQQQQPNGNIQPLRGEPPLTLYRDRRTLVLQPGTELDRFGDPTGNVTYAAHTPYSQRSLPPQWSTRQYAAFRVQRPVQALRGTAVPWFEQPGGGTAYVLPGPVSDLLADGTLQEINDAQRPPNE